RKRKFIFDARVASNQQSHWNTEMRRHLGRAIHNRKILNDYSFAAHQRLADDWGLPKPEHDSWRGGELLQLVRDEGPVFVQGHDASLGLLYIPGFLKDTSLTNYTEALESHMRMEFPVPATPSPNLTGQAVRSQLPPEQDKTIGPPAPPRRSARLAAAHPALTPAPAPLPQGSASHSPEPACPLVSTGQSSTPVKSTVAGAPSEGPASGKPVPARNAGDRDRPDLGPTGVRHWGFWHAQGHQATFSAEPTRDTTKSPSTMHFTSKVQLFHSFQPVDHRVNYLTNFVGPEFYSKLEETFQGAVEHPGFRLFSTEWNTPFPGRAVLVNRQSGEHLDQNGVRRGFDVIIAAGEFTGGDFYFKDMHVRCPFLPGDLVMFDGTAQRHKIEPFEGRIRLSHVYFAHRSVMTEFGVDPTLEDVYTFDIALRLAQFNRVQGPEVPPGFYSKKRPAEGSSEGAVAGRKRARRGRH
ncbi:hypothetical protein FRC07_006474, partial [Ceratobasidium sp. 392]